MDETVLFLAEEPGEDDATLDVAQQIATLARVAAICTKRDAALWIVTCEAQQATVTNHGAGLVGGALWGLGRALVNEMPQLTVRLLDFSHAAALSDRAKQVAAEVTAVSVETEVVWTPHGRHVPRLRRGLPHRWAKASDVLSLSTGHPGAIEALGWEYRTATPVGPGQVEIEVYAAGLNFRDIMWAMGLLPEEALSDGFAGPHSASNAPVSSRSRPGGQQPSRRRPVMAFAPASLSSRVVTSRKQSYKIPAANGFAECRNNPCGIRHRDICSFGPPGKALPGEHGLIHTASGGVGLAAIQYAKQHGATVTARPDGGEAGVLAARRRRLCF